GRQIAGNLPVEQRHLAQFLVIQGADSRRAGAVQQHRHAFPKRFSLLDPGIGYHGRLTGAPMSDLSVELRDQLSIDTPELVSLEYPVAGIGSRAIACLLDYLIQSIAGTLILLLLALIAS